MIYRIEVKRSARKALLALPPNVRQCLRAAIDELAANPGPPGVRKITEAHALYRHRLGDYRIIYEILDDRLLVMVV